MASAWWVNSFLGSTGYTSPVPVSGAEQFYRIGSAAYGAHGTTEAWIQVPIYELTDFTLFATEVITNTTTTVTYTGTFRVNGSAVNQTFTIMPGTTGHFEDTSNTDSVSGGDLISGRIVASGSSEASKDFEHKGISVVATPDDSGNTLSKAACGSTNFNLPYLSGPYPFYSALWGQIHFGTSRLGQENCVNRSFTVDNAAVYVISNSADAATIATLQKDGVDTSLAVSITASTTGTFEDTSNSASIADGDHVGWEWTSPGYSTGTLRIGTISAEIISTNDEWWGGSGQNGVNVADNVTAYGKFGEIYIPTTTEGIQPRIVNLDGDITQFCTYVNVNTIDENPSELVTRVNGSDGNNSITITAGTTGWFDVDATDQFNDTETINWKVVAGENTGNRNLGITAIDFIATPQAASTGTIQVVKVTVPSSNPQEFDFTAGGGLSPTSFSLAHGEVQVFSGLTPGSGFSVVEDAEDGWTTVYSVSNDAGDDNTDISVSAGEVVTVTVTNTLDQRARSGIYKIIPNSEKDDDTLWDDLDAETTEDVAIPNPFGESAPLGS